MRLRRLLVSWFALCSLLLQSTAFAWTPHAMPAQHAPSQAVEMQLEHCHGDDAAKQAADTGNCCFPDGQCDCALMCASAMAALPAAPAGLSEFIRAHFAASRRDNRPLPPSASSRFRPPISCPG